MARQKSEFLKGWGKAFEVFKAIVDSVLALGGGDADLERVLTDKTLRTEIAKLIVGTAKVIRSVSVVTAPAVAKFVAHDRFTVNIAANLPVRIGYLGDNFKKHFLSKTEENVARAELTSFQLTKDSLDRDILAQLGDTAEISLAHLWYLLSLQPNGEPGFLLTNGYANIFYIRDASGILWAVRADWDAGYGHWGVEAYSVSGPDGWSAGRQVVSRE